MNVDVYTLAEGVPRYSGLEMSRSKINLADSNLHAWQDVARIERYSALQGWIDDGERIAISSVADRVRGQPVLDIGVGTGRTTWLLRLLTADYVAIDWSPTMVQACRAMCPGVDVRQGDARDLSAFPASHFKLVLFSYNGLDNLDHAGRERVYEEVRRVLQPGGIFAYSTFSKEGRLYTRQRSTWRDAKLSGVRRAREAMLNMPVQLLKHPRNYQNWRRSYRASEDHERWGLAPVPAVDFNLAHFTSVAGEREKLAEHGFRVVEIFSDIGERIVDSSGAAPWFLVVAEQDLDKVAETGC